MRYIISSNGELLAKTTGIGLRPNKPRGELEIKSDFDVSVLSLFKYENGRIVKKSPTEIQALEQKRTQELATKRAVQEAKQAQLDAAQVTLKRASATTKERLNAIAIILAER